MDLDLDRYVSGWSVRKVTLDVHPPSTFNSSALPLIPASVPVLASFPQKKNQSQTEETNPIPICLIFFLDRQVIVVPGETVRARSQVILSV